MTRPEVVRLLAFLAGAYPSLKVTDPMIESWALVLEHDEAKAIQAAALRYIRSGKSFPPVLADLCSDAAEADAGLPEAEAAWSEVGRWRKVAREAAATQGSYTLPPWSSPLTGQIIEDLGGWGAVCEEDEPGVLRAHFLRLYTTFRAGAQRASNYRSGGLALPKPVSAFLPHILGSSLPAGDSP